MIIALERMSKQDDHERGLSGGSHLGGDRAAHDRASKYRSAQLVVVKDHRYGKGGLTFVAKMRIS